MNLRFIVLSLPIVFGIFASAIISFVITKFEGLSANPWNIFFLLIGVIILIIHTAFLCVLFSDRVIKSKEQESIFLRRKLDEVEKRQHFDESQAMVMNRVTDLHETFAISRDLNVVLNQAVSALKDILKVQTLVLQLYSDEESRFFMRIEEGDEDIEIGDELRMEIILGGKSRLINNLKDDPNFKDLFEKGYSSLIVAALTRVETGTRRKSIGLIAALTSGQREFTAYELELLATFSGQAALLIDNARLYKRVEALAIRDGMTNLFNYRHFKEGIEQEIDKAEKSGFPLTLIILDIDDFKKYNDAFGHPEGDEVLRSLSDILLDNTRGRDFVARYGGEEFVILLPETSRGGAMTVAQTIREKVESFPFGNHNSSHPPVRMTITAGLAIYPDDARSAKDLISAADKALFKGKRNGKNRVVTVTS